MRHRKNRRFAGLIRSSCSVYKFFFRTERTVTKEFVDHARCFINQRRCFAAIFRRMLHAKKERFSLFFGGLRYAAFFRKDKPCKLDRFTAYGANSFYH